MTHSQRCVTTVMAHGITAPVPLRDMLARLDAVLCRTYNTLPRDAELAMVHRAHKNPQFIEDALRAAVVALAGAWPDATAIQTVSGHSRSQESIHDYDLTATIRLSVADLPFIG